MVRTHLKSLMKPEAYPEKVTGVELVQTHVSWIFLTDLYAYKIKKPVDFGFLNFSTIDRRRFYCNEEVRLNRRLCPDIYEGVVEVREAPGGAAFHGNGAVIDHAVRMKRLPKERMLDRLVEENAVSTDDMREVARTIADFHNAAPSSPAVSEFARIERIMYNWQENFEQTAAFEGSTLPRDDREAIRGWINSFLVEHSDLFEKRIENGYIRECDGDIHLENICLDNGRVYIFDCIEFNDRFRFCDTAADVAFLLMDLDYNCRPDLAETVLNEYLKLSVDAGMPQLLDFYKIYRAFVRGKVESFRLNDPGINAPERELARKRAVRYFRLARGYVERRRTGQTLFMTCGLIGSGKSSLAAQLSFELGISRYDSDSQRKRMKGIAPETAMPEQYGEGIYSQATTDATYSELLRMAETGLDSGASLIIDATFGDKSHRAAFIRSACEHGAKPVILHLKCPEQEILTRLAARKAAGSSVSDGRPELLAPQQAVFENPAEDGNAVVIELDATAPPERLTSRIYARLAGS